jgi:anthranilate phosphoribosyltransferase
MIGPLLNPAEAKYTILGVYRRDLVPFYAELLRNMPLRRALVVHGEGLDELSCIGQVEMMEIAQGEVRKIIFDPTQVGLKNCTLQDLQGGEPKKNAQLLIEGLSGKNRSVAETLALNAGTALYLTNRLPTIKEGVKLAIEAIEQGKALDKIKEMIAFAPIVGDS